MDNEINQEADTFIKDLLEISKPVGMVTDNNEIIYFNK